jgi:flagellar motor switch protein FliN/FliY
VSLLVCLDPRLCLKITQRLAKQPDTLLDPLPPIEAPLLGAVAALVSHLLDDAALDTPVRIGWGHLPESTGQRATFEGILHWGQGSYELVLVFDLPWAPTQERVPPVDLAVLGDLPLSPRLRIGQSRLSTAELGRITVGAVFLPGPDLWLDSEGRGQGYLVAPEGDWSYPCNLVDGGRIVLGAHAVNRDIDAPDPKEASTNCARGSKTTSAKSLADVLAETPLTVQIELGVVTLPAREFARLLPGDVIETQSNLGEPVTLRIAGRAVASAELVNIEGQLGLRIRELFTGELR